MIDWKQATVGDLITLQRGIDLPEGEREPGSTPIMGSFGITGWHNKPACRGPGVTVGRSGASIGTVNFIEQDYWPLNTCLYAKNFHGNNPRFAFYFLKTLDLKALNSGSAQPSLNRNFVHPVPILLPPRCEQDGIASILSALDDKIGLNRRMNETLEAMARAIFKDWFVDFGPTRAKMESRPPYLAPDLWALFPDRLDEEGKPEGWDEQRVDDLLELGYGKSLPASVRVNGECPVYGSGGISGFHNEALLSAPSVIVGRKGTVGSVFWEDRPCFPIDTVFYVMPRGVSLSFCFYLLNSLGLSEMNTDAAVPGLNRNNVYRLSGRWGDATLRQNFDEVVWPLRQKMFANDEEARSLIATRDLLLPRLMSGEIQVREAESLLGAVA
jgi:type I restriction enzyme S subunit